MAGRAAVGSDATWAAKPVSPWISGVRSRLANACQEAKAPPSGAGQSAWPRSKWEAAQWPIRSATRPGQSSPDASAARSATVGSATGRGAGPVAASRSASGVGGAPSVAAIAAARSSSVISPASISARRRARGGVRGVPATRARRAAAIASGSPAWPR